ncbi:MAG: imidazolonepropionase [Povalibacter sp.]
MSSPPSPEPDRWDRVWLGANLATMQDNSLGVISSGALATKDGRIAWLGEAAALNSMRWSAETVTQARGLWITPGLIECHTHLVYAGDRSNEFEARLRGATYEEIAREGGGILSTMRATRSASEEELFAQSLLRAQAFVREGVTTLEVKSGYGLDLQSERKMLRVGRRLGTRLGIHVVNSFLGAHALPPEYAGRRDEYVDFIVDQMMPAFASEGLIDAVDVFHESIAFSTEQTHRIFDRARELKLPLRLHADQLNDNGGGALAADFAALSADHLEFASEISLQRMAEQQVVAGLLPVAFYYLREKQRPPIERLRALGVPMAVSSDCNPGTSPLVSLHLAMNMACVLFGLSPQEAWLGVTCHASRALGLAHDRGMLRVGMRADLAIWNVIHPAQVCATFGTQTPLERIVAGERVAAI